MHSNYLEDPIEWSVSDKLVPYEQAVAFMEQRVQEIASGDGRELVWLLEHPPLYTGGTSAKIEDLKSPDQFPVHKTRRGGQFTYHGPGQRVAYVMLDLNKRTKDVRKYIQDLENWIINSLSAFNIDGEIKEGRVGVWVDRSRPASPVQEDKIAAIGVRIKKWVTFHGIALNIEPDLAHFDGIVPCGINDEGLGVTSLVDLGHPVTMDEVDAILEDNFTKMFGPIQKIEPIHIVPSP